MPLTREQLSLNRRTIVDQQKWYWFDQIGWHPHRGQMPMHLSKARYRLSCAGRQGGKTAWAAMEASAYMIAGPFKVWFGGPSYELVMREWETFTKALQSPANPHEILALNSNPRSGHIYIALSNGATAHGKSLDVAAKNPAIGDAIDLLVGCEFAQQKYVGGDQGLWNQQIAGDLMTRLGDVILPTTPKGKDKWLYPMFKIGLAGTDPDIFAHQWPSWENPAWLEDPFKLRKTMSKRAFDEQVRGLFVSWAGAIWLKDCLFDPDKHIIDVMYDIPNWYHRIEIIDPGYSDYLFWIAAVVDNHGVIYIVDEFRAKKMMWADLVNVIYEKRIKMYGEGNVPSHIPVLVDPENPRARADLADAATKHNPPFTMQCIKAVNDVWAGFSAGMSNFGADREFVTKNCIHVIDSLENHEWSSRVNSKGMRVEERDEQKHGSDVVRYLQMFPVHPSIEPIIETIKAGIGYDDLIGEPEAIMRAGMDFNQWKRMYGGQVA